jgi:hypothetical protein
MLDKFYKELDNTDKSTLFNYFVILIVFIGISQLLTVKLSLILTLVIAILIIFYINYRKQDKKIEEEIIIEDKYDKIRPQTEIIKRYSDIIDFIFSIQEMYIYNPPAFEEVVDNIEEFLKYLEDSRRFPENAGSNYPIMESKKKYAVNSLHSLIYNLPANKYFINKMERGMEKLNDILDEYLDEVYKLNNDNIKDNGYNARSTVIYKGPKPTNFYEKENYTFERI